MHTTWQPKQKLLPIVIVATSQLYAPANINDGNKETYWATDDATTKGSITIDLPKKSTVQYIVLQEYIQLGQRVKSFNVQIWKDNAWQQVAAATTIGHKRILKIDPVETKKVRVNITDCKGMSAHFKHCFILNIT